MSSFLLLQQCPRMSGSSNLDSFRYGGKWSYSYCFVGVLPPGTCLILLAAFLCNCRQAFSR